MYDYPAWQTLKGEGGNLGAQERVGRAREKGKGALIPFPFPFERLPHRLMYDLFICLR